MHHQSTNSRQAAEIRQSARDYFFRTGERPSTDFVRRRQDPEVRKAKAQARTAAWRAEGERLKRPELRDIGMALVTALATSPNLPSKDLTHGMTKTELGFVTVALEDLASRGFDRKQTEAVLRRLRNRLVDPADRQGEETETTGPAIEPTAWHKPENSPLY